MKLILQWGGRKQKSVVLDDTMKQNNQIQVIACNEIVSEERDKKKRIKDKKAVKKHTMYSRLKLFFYNIVVMQIISIAKG